MYLEVRTEADRLRKELTDSRVANEEVRPGLMSRMSGFSCSPRVGTCWALRMTTVHLFGLIEQAIAAYHPPAHMCARARI